MDKCAEVAGYQFDRNGNQDDAEKLAEYIDAAFAQKFFEIIDVAQSQIDNDNVGYQAEHNVQDAVFGTKRQKCGKCSGACNKREDNRDQRGRALRTVSVTENLDA